MTNLSNNWEATNILRSGQANLGTTNLSMWQMVVSVFVLLNRFYIRVYLYLKHMSAT